MSLIVMEGLDGSGKGTQTALLARAFKEQGLPVRTVTFPDYASPSSSLVKMYLAGDFGREPDSVNAYAASAFYAVDRFASYRTAWQRDYEAGTLILADRYVTSNMVFQMGKLPRERWEEFARWLDDFEYGRLGLPRPDGVIYCDMPIEVSQKLLKKRYDGDEGRKDIHERDLAFLNHCRAGAMAAAQWFGWQRVDCARDGAPRPVEEIHREILSLVQDILKKEEQG